MQQSQKRKKMVSKKLLKEYEFESIDTYYGYIIESHINGQFKQRDELINKLSKEQKKEFATSLMSDESMSYAEIKKEIFNVLI